MKSPLKGKSGFTLVEIMIVVAIIGILVAIAIPNYLRARERARTNACITNLRQIQGAIVIAELDNISVTGFTELVPDYLQETPICPGTGTNTYDASVSPPTCSYTVPPAFDATEYGHTL